MSDQLHFDLVIKIDVGCPLLKIQGQNVSGERRKFSIYKTFFILFVNVKLVMFEKEAEIFAQRENQNSV